MKNEISETEIESYALQIKKFSNSGQYKKAYALSLRLHKKYPEVFRFAYLEAVFTAEDTKGLSKKESDRLYRLAASKLKKLFPKLRSVTPRLRRSVRNEYYWFSKQPRKQYQLGLSEVRRGDKTAHYSMGVGAAMLSKKYGLAGKKLLSVRWAKISEEAWLEYFKVVPNWYNSYLFYAMALGFQGKIKEMNKALDRGCKISGLTRRDEYFMEVEEAVKEVLGNLGSKKR